MTPIVSIIMGSTSDLPVMEKAAQLLNDLHVPFEMNALSAHRTPEAVEEFAKNACSRGIKVIIAAAGMAAALGGNRLPMRLSGYRCPIKGSVLDGVDALYSIIQMPPRNTGSNRSNQRGNECSYLGCTDVSFGRYRTCKHFCDLQRRLEKENCKSQ